MNFSNILNEIEKIDPEVYERTSGRRHLLKSFGAKVAVAALPFALGSLFKKAYGQTSGDIPGVLNFALTLEYLEAEFYATAIASNGLIPSGAASGAIATIGGHEAAHVNFLKTAITASGNMPVGKPNFDFTAGGLFPDVFSNYATFLAVAQAFEDTGVRAYKGQAGNLKSSNDVLTAALNIHSVEARHASHIRQMRKNNNQGNVKPWITGNQSGIGSPAVQPIYDGEENTTQAGLQITNINSSGVTADAASECFDEPLEKQQVMSIVGPFIVP
ncbi:ferritin-like domain-containing protein [Taibaiella koreensis]|uniref:ferritin-like domain-containing protein n=1 Tax=Taibaiella koreensis TaxID=1268548 RepID=UPI000E59DA41|nr:ferritin-like domain-containing protein [Taibaiella koreensis]